MKSLFHCCYFVLFMFSGFKCSSTTLRGSFVIIRQDNNCIRMFYAVFRSRRIVEFTFIIVIVKVIGVQCFSRPFLVKKIFSVAAKHSDRQVNLYGIPMERKSLDVQTIQADEHDDNNVFKDNIDNPEMDKKIKSVKAQTFNIPIPNNGITGINHLSKDIVVKNKILDIKNKPPSNCWFHDPPEKNRPKSNIRPKFGRRNDERNSTHELNNSLTQPKQLPHFRINNKDSAKLIDRNKSETFKSAPKDAVVMNIYKKGSHDYLHDIFKLSLDRCLLSSSCLGKMYWWNMLNNRSKHSSPSRGSKLIRRKRQEKRQFAVKESVLGEQDRLTLKKIYDYIVLGTGQKEYSAYDMGLSLRFLVEHISLWFGIPPYYEHRQTNA